MKSEPTHKGSLVIVLVITFVAIIGLLLYFQNSNTTTEPAEVVSEENTEAVEPAGRDLITVPFGETGNLATLDVKINDFEYRDTLSGSFGETQAKADTTFVLVDASFTNTSGETYTLYSSGMDLINKEGVSYSVYESTSGGAIGIEEDAIDGTDLGHSIEETGFLIYEVPKDFTPYAIEIEKAGTNETLVLELPEVTEPEPDEVAYRIIEEDDISYAGCKRLAVRVVVPDDAAERDVEHTLYLLARDYLIDWDDVTVWAWGYSEESQVGSSVATKGTVEESLPGACG